MKSIGLTGGIGMGKSLVQELLQKQGVPVIDTDRLARDIVEPGQPALQEVAAAFGPDILTSKGELRREELARRVFQDVSARETLELILHPRIRSLWRSQLATWESDGKPLAVVVIPLLFETGAERELDITICVACSRTTQQRRLLARGWSSNEIDQRLNAQWPIDKKMTASDLVIWNDSTVEVLEDQLHRLLSLISTRSWLPPRLRLL